MLINIDISWWVVLWTVLCIEYSFIKEQKQFSVRIRQNNIYEACHKKMCLKILVGSLPANMITTKILRRVFPWHDSYKTLFPGEVAIDLVCTITLFTKRKLPFLRQFFLKTQGQGQWHRVIKTIGQGQWPWGTTKNWWRKGNFLSVKSVYIIIM